MIEANILVMDQPICLDRLGVNGKNPMDKVPRILRSDFVLQTDSGMDPWALPRHCWMFSPGEFSDGP
jgi:hypothetical protein